MKFRLHIVTEYKMLDIINVSGRDVLVVSLLEITCVEEWQYKGEGNEG